MDPSTGGRIPRIGQPQHRTNDAPRESVLVTVVLLSPATAEVGKPCADFRNGEGAQRSGQLGLVGEDDACARLLDELSGTADGGYANRSAEQHGLDQLPVEQPGR